MVKDQETRFSLQKRKQSFGYAFKGLIILVKTQHNSWIHIIAAIVAIITGIIFNLNYIEWCLVSIAIGLVLVSEIINTSIEFLTNLVSPDYNELAGKVKDLAAAAVLVAAFTAISIGLFVFLPRIIILFGE